MKFIATVAIALAGLLTAACGSSDTLDLTAEERTAALEAKVAALESEAATSTTIEPTTTTTTTPPTTTITACVPGDATAQQRYVDTTEGSIRQVEGAIAQIQLVIDNGTRDRASALRYQESVQVDYDKAAAAFKALPLDTNRDRLTYQEDRLADAKDVVAKWDSLLAKARGDLTRAKAQKADFERKVRDMRAQIAAVQSC